MPPLLADSEIEEVLTILPDLTKWADGILAYATDAAVNHGKEWNGFKVVEGRSVRKYKDEELVAQAAKHHDPAVEKPGSMPLLLQKNHTFLKRS